MNRNRIPEHRKGEQGFILALGLLLLAALALIGTAAISTSSFQNDIANNMRLNQEAYYAAQAGIAESIQAMALVRPVQNRMTRTFRPLYYVGSINKTTGSIQEQTSCNVDGNQPGDILTCACAGQGRDCVAVMVEVELKQVGNAPASFGIGQYQMSYYQVASTARGSQGNESRVAVYVALLHQMQYGYGGAGGGS